MNQGIHTVDLLLWLLGDPDSVFARTRTALHEIEVEDVAVACLSFPGGALATLEATTAGYPGYPRRLELTGTNGTIVVEGARVVSVDLREPPAEPPPGAEAGSEASGHRRVLEDFLAAIESDGTPKCDGREGRRSVALIEAIYQSSHSGAAVSPRAIA
jgi:predicted dehydrogenase